MKDTLYYLIYPALVAIASALAAFFGSYWLQKKETTRQKQNEKYDFVEKMTISLQVLSSALEKLSKDPTQYNYFSLQTTASIKPILQRINLLINDKLALFQDISLRTNVISTLDEVNSIIDEIESKELTPVNKYNEHQNIVKETVAEYNAFKVKLLELGFYLDGNNEPQNLQFPTNNEPSVIQSNFQKQQQIRNIVQGLISKINDSQAQLNTINQQTKEQRAFLAVRLLNAQSSVKSLMSDLKKAI